MSLNLTGYERETIICYNEAEKTASVYTHNAALLRRLEGLAQEYPDVCRLERTNHEGAAADYIIPKKWVKVKPPRVMSDA